MYDLLERPVVPYIPFASSLVWNRSQVDPPSVTVHVSFSPDWFRARTDLDFGPRWHASFVAMGGTLNMEFPRLRLGGPQRHPPGDFPCQHVRDGGSALWAGRRLRRVIVLPMVKSGLLVVGLIVFMDIWKNFTCPLITISKLDMYTVSLNISRLFGTQREVYWRQIMAACFMSSLPLIVIFLIFRRTFISGITAGAFK
jgi:hypothetical protein